MLDMTKGERWDKRTMWFMPQNVVLLANSQKQPITNIAQSRLEHAPIGELLVHAGKPEVDMAGPFFGSLSDARDGADHGEDDDPLNAPFFERLDGGCAGAACSDHRVEQDGQTGWTCIAAGVGYVVGQVVVVFYRGEGCGLTVEAQVVDWN